MMRRGNVTPYWGPLIMDARVKPGHDAEIGESA
jgi:hypothetical protein